MGESSDSRKRRCRLIDVKDPEEETVVAEEIIAGRDLLVFLPDLGRCQWHGCGWRILGQYENRVGFHLLESGKNWGLDPMASSTAMISRHEASGVAPGFFRSP